jgi:MULE transposase domain
MPWKAKAGCAEHHRSAVERIVNLLPSEWLSAFKSGELFDSLEHCDRRLRGYSFAEGFDIVGKGEGSKTNPSWRFFCLAHGVKT